MTHDLLRSDIELATKLRDDQYPDEEIILALVQRGVDRGKAALLLEDLRSGKKITVEVPLPPEFGLAHRSRSKSAARGTQPSPPRRSHGSASPRESSGRPTARAQKKSGVLWLVVAALLVLLLVAVGIALLLHRSQTSSLAPPALALQPDGLHLGASKVTPDNVLIVVANSLGVATRTNEVGQTDTVIYAYDHQGLLIYSQQAGATNSIILDCEASGGIHGTTSPFAGTLTVDGQVIRADTDSQTLAAIKQLGLTHPGSHSDIWGGRYHNLELVFAYLKSPRHLSLIEIDLK